VLTYFEPDLGRAVLTRMLAHLQPQGALVVGIHERLPGGFGGLEPWPECRVCYCRCGDSADHPQA